LVNGDKHNPRINLITRAPEPQAKDRVLLHSVVSTTGTYLVTLVDRHANKMRVLFRKLQ
jgi:hypothetical protein